jgi:hypothetical protein
VLLWSSHISELTRALFVNKERIGEVAGDKILGTFDRQFAGELLMETKKPLALRLFCQPTW